MGLLGNKGKGNAYRYWVCKEPKAVLWLACHHIISVSLLAKQRPFGGGSGVKNETNFVGVFHS